MKKKTVEGRLEEMIDDLAKLQAALNKDKQFGAALQCAGAIVAVDQLIETNQIPDEAKWPPKVILEEGEPCWETVGP